MKKIFFFVLLTNLFSNSFGQITTSINPTIAQMQALLQGNGVVISGLTKTCPAGAYATFNNGAAALGGLNSGILLTTGTASNVAGPTPNTTSNNLSFNSSAPGSALGDGLSGGTTYDGCYITFLITPNCSTLSIKYVFASEEYPEYSVPGPLGAFNDVFGFALSGPNPSGGNYNQQNIATVPGAGATPVGIANVNNGNSNTGPCVNCTYYQGAPGGLEYDGRTAVLSASANVTPCQTYTMTIGIWDDNDGNFDSGVFLDVNGLSCLGTPTITAVASPSTICGAQTVTLTTGGGIASGTYTWVAPASGGLGATITGTTITANPTAATIYTVQYSDINTCPGVPLTQTTSVSFTPPTALPVSQSPAGAICAGQSVTLTANGGAGTYSWSPGTALSTTTNSTTVSTPSATTTYTVTKTVGTCVSSTVITVSVNSTSTSITPSLSTICAGQTATLTAGGGGPFTWTASSGANPPGTAVISVSPITTTTYTVLVGSGSCTASAVATVSISSVPSINITPSNTTICLGQSAALSSSGGGPFTWSASSGAAPASAANVTVTPTTTTTYTVLSGTGTCTATAVATVSVSTATPISITPSLSTICVGQSVGLSSTGAGPFTWTASSGTTPPSVANVTVSPTTTTTYTVLSGTGTCTASAVATVSISAVPSINITPSNTTICLGQSTSLSSSGSAPFTWTASSGIAPAGTASVTVSPTVLTTYTVLSGAGTCTATATATVNVISVTASITASSPYYCLGVAPVTLTGSGATTYSWSGTDLSSTSGAVVTATPSATTIYTVTGTTSGCTSTQTVSITVPPLSTLTAVANPSIICVGGPGTTLTATGANTYTWVPGSITTATTYVTPATTTQYTVAGQTIAGCYAVPAVVTVTVLPAINMALTASSSSVCVTKTVTISASSPTTGLTYTWQPTTAIQGANNTFSIVALPQSSANVIYTVTISNGLCANTNTIQLLVKTPPSNNHFITLNNDTVCVGGCVTFSATTAGSQPMSYQWYYEVGVGTSSVGIAPEACYPSAGTFSVMSIASNVCGVDTVVQSNFVTVYDMPVVSASNDTTINIGESAQIYATGGLTYLWVPSPNGSIACPTCSNTVVQPTVTTQYIVYVSNSPYCKVWDTVNVIVDVNCGDFFIPNVFSPNGDGLNDVINVHGRCIQTFNLQIFNRWGEKVFETSSASEGWDGTFRGQKLDTGVFVYKADGVSIDGQSFKLKGNITLIR